MNRAGFAARPHSSLGYQTPAAFVGILAATESDVTLDMNLASPPVAQTAPYGVTETVEVEPQETGTIEAIGHRSGLSNCNGCAVRVCELLRSGTISGSTRDSRCAYSTKAGY